LSIADGGEEEGAEEDANRLGDKETRSEEGEEIDEKEDEEVESAVKG
jgi:hypothetical protein